MQSPCGEEVDLKRGGLISLVIGGGTAGFLVAWSEQHGLATLWWLLPLACLAAWTLSRALHLMLGQLSVGPSRA